MQNEKKMCRNVNVNTSSDNFYFKKSPRDGQLAVVYNCNKKVTYFTRN